MDTATARDDELDALLAAAVDASGDLLPVSDDALDDVSASLSFLGTDAWWMVDDTSEELPAVLPTRQQPNSANRADGRAVANRQRVKEELEHLRLRVQELEDQLTTARAAFGPAAPVSSSSNGPIAHGVDQFWQRLAQSEREARQRTVAENVQLREQLEAQLRIARSLEKLLNKRPRDVGGLSSSHSSAFKRLRRRDAHDDDGRAVFEALISNLDARYQQTDAVFSECGLTDRHETFQDAHVRLGGRSPSEGTTDTSSCVEFVTSNLVPFDYDMTRDVAWRALQSPTIPLPNGVYEVVETSENLVKATFSVITKLRGSDVVSRAPFVAKQYIENERAVVIWALASIVQGGILKNHRVELLEEGWSAISPYKDKTELTLTQACGRLRPRMVVRAGSKMEELVGLLTDVFLDCYHDTQQGLYDFYGPHATG